MKRFSLFLLIIIIGLKIYGQGKIPSEFYILKNKYPDIEFNINFDSAFKDWKIDMITNDKRTYTFYWANGSILPKEEMGNKDKYWTIFYPYSKELRDPSDFSEAEKKQLKEFSSTENRRNGAGTPMFVYDAIYDSFSRGSLEKHLRKINFLGQRINVHEKIVEPLARVEEQILDLAKENKNVEDFLNKIKTVDAYYWREISGTNRKSFHSLGIAIDILPIKITGEIYWSWAKDKNPNGWMLTPLKARWMPPKEVIEIFEKEGFIWGGKWAIWDNMHFEYHPELIRF